MVKIRDFLKKTGDTKRTSDAKICTTKASTSQKQRRLRRGGKNTQNCTKKS